MENGDNSCENFPLSLAEENLGKYSSLQEIVDVLEQAEESSPCGLKAEPAFIGLKEIAAEQTATGQIPRDANLQKIVEELQSKNYEAKTGLLTCTIAFTCLKQLALKHKFSP